MRMLRGGRSGRVSYPVSLGSHKKDTLNRRILDTWNLERPSISEWWMLKILSVASKHVHVSKKHVLIGCKRDLFCRQTFEVWSRRLLSTWFFFHSTKYCLQEFLDVKNNFWRQVCCFWAGNMPESWEKWNMSGTHRSKTCKQLTFGSTVCFNGCQTSNVWWPNTSCLAPY